MLLYEFVISDDNDKCKAKYKFDCGIAGLSGAIITNKRNKYTKRMNYLVIQLLYKNYY